MTTFHDFSLDPKLLEALDGQGITDPTPIQAQAIGPALEGRDIVAVAQTGTGKTLAFSLPILTRLAGKDRAKPNSALVLTPTRELACQVHGVCAELAKTVKLRCACLYGGVSVRNQADELKRGSHVIVATPGRLLDHLERRNLNFKRLETLVIDEADRMLDMGFLPDIIAILRQLPGDRQTIMSSATFPPEISRLAQRFLRDPEEIAVGAISKPVEKVRQLLYTVGQGHKVGLLKHILRHEHIDSALIFIRTRQRTEVVTKALRRHGFKARAIHGDRSQVQREQALRQFREGKIDMLVATDVAARGLDIESVSHVINFDIPENPDDYIHRIGRTARASAEGDAITFVSPNDYLALEAIERALNQNLPRAEWEGAVKVLSMFTPQSQKRRSGSRRRRSAFRRR